MLSRSAMSLRRLNRAVPGPNFIGGEILPALTHRQTVEGLRGESSPPKMRHAVAIGIKSSESDIGGGSPENAKKPAATIQGQRGSDCSSPVCPAGFPPSWRGVVLRPFLARSPPTNGRYISDSNLDSPRCRTSGPRSTAICQNARGRRLRFLGKRLPQRAEATRMP